MQREDFEQRYIDYMRSKCPNLHDFIKYTESCYVADRYEFNDMISNVPYDTMKLILSYLHLNDIIHLSTSSPKLLRILNDDQYWMLKYKRQYLDYPLIGRRVIVLEGRKHSEFKIRWFDIYQHHHTVGNLTRTLNTFLWRKYGLKLPKNGPKPKIEHYEKAPWPPEIIQYVKNCGKTIEYGSSIEAVATILAQHTNAETAKCFDSLEGTLIEKMSTWLYKTKLKWLWDEGAQTIQAVKQDEGIKKSNKKRQLE